MSDIYIQFQLLINANEISGGTAGMTLWEIRDSTTGRFFGLRYDYTNHKFQLYTNFSTLESVDMPWALDDSYNSFRFHVTDQVSVWFNGTFYGQTSGFLGFNGDFMALGGMDNTAADPVDHRYRSILVGSSAGAGDIFNPANAFAGKSPGQSVVPPFDSVVGVSTVFSVQNFQALSVVASPGDVNAYVLKRVAVTPPPPPLPLLADPGDGNIKIVGDSDWKMSGQPAWILDNWGLDRLIIPMRGSRKTRDAFLAKLTPWMPYPYDLGPVVVIGGGGRPHDISGGGFGGGGTTGGSSRPPTMFLADITQEQRGSTNFPQIDLIFTGKRGGILPPDRNQSSEQIQQISGRGVFNTAHTVGCTFISTTSEQTVWSRQPIDLSDVSPLEPAALDLMWLTETDVVYWAGTFEAFQAIINTNVSACFVARVVTTGQSEEIVPGQYYRATRTKQRLLFPVLT